MQAGVAVAGRHGPERVAGARVIARMMLFIKHRLPWLWVLVDWTNARLFSLLHKKQMLVETDRAFSEFQLDGFRFAPLEADDLPAFEALLKRQGEARLRYFKPHGFDREDLAQMLHNPAFLMFGVFRNQATVGYFFLRCFWNRKCFVGRLIDQPQEGQGIGRVMNPIMYHVAWRSGFRCMTTISKENQQVIRSHRNNPHARVIGELSNGYIWVEFVEVGDASSGNLL